MSDFFDGFAGGMFGKVEHIEVGLTRGHTQGKIISKLTFALKARESVGTYPSLAFIDVGPGKNLSVLRQLLLLESCSNLSELRCYAATQNNTKEFLKILDSYMRLP